MRIERLDELYRNQMITEAEREEMYFKMVDTRKSYSLFAILTFVVSILGLVVSTSFRHNGATITLITNDTLRLGLIGLSFVLGLLFFGFMLNEMRTRKYAGSGIAHIGLGILIVLFLLSFPNMIYLVFFKS